MNKILKGEEFSTEWIKFIDLNINMNYLCSKNIVYLVLGFMVTWF